MKKPQYPLSQLIFYKLQSKARLVKVLFPKNTPEEGERILRNLLKNKGHMYDCWKDNGRPIEHPDKPLKRIHKRISIILARVLPPDFLHSAYKKRSYVTNASAHVGACEVQKVDITRFFPSTSTQHLKHFFRSTLKCSPDVAAIMAELLTFDGHLPTGSPVSPILSYWTHSEMFGKIASYCEQRKLTFTLYVDDLAISGTKVERRDLAFVLRVIKAHALRVKRKKLVKYNKHDTKKITGIIVKEDGIYPPSSRHQELNNLIEQALANPKLLKVEKFRQGIDGRLNEVKQINPGAVAKIERKLTALYRREV
jgi:hypothetical protein